MLTSVHIADVGGRTALSLLRRAPSPASAPGLRSAEVGLATPLRTGLLPAAPPSGRIALIMFWDDDASLDAYEAGGALDAFAGGWHTRLTPLRAYGSWPGLDAGVPKQRVVEHDGLSLVLTLGRLKWSRAVTFFRTSQKAEAAARASDMIWGTAFARPPFVATCSLWSDARSIAAYAFEHAETAHPSAIAADRAKPFHHQEAFIRFRPYATAGSLAGANPLKEQQYTDG